jgi:sensor c-di-GMP phosphodiesterase-like protein
MLKRIVVLMVAVVFALVSLPALAADQWAVIKDSKGRCYVKQVTKKTEKTIAGPFAAKAEAEKAKKEQCPPAKKEKK